MPRSARLSLLAMAWLGACGVAPPAPDTSTGARNPAALAAGLAIVLHVPTAAGIRIGTAFPWSGRLLVTNSHVVQGVGIGGEVSADHDNRIARLRLVARSSRIDLAVLCQLTGEVAAAPIGRTDQPRAGEPVFAAGPIALSPRADRIVLRGNIGSTGQHDIRFGPGLIAELPGARPGFSGTALIDGAGRVVGMLAAIRAANTSQASAFVPARPTRSLAGGATQAFVLEAAAIRAEIADLLAGAAGGPAGPSAGTCPG